MNQGNQFPVKRAAQTFKRMCLAFACGAFSLQAHAEFKDPLDFPSIIVNRLNERPMQAVVKAGNRVVAVGPRGMIALSDNDGKTWKQSVSPVQSDLVAVHFPVAQDGWTVGHDGVVLHSSDAGKTWKKQLDGRIAKDAFVKYYKVKAGLDEARRSAALKAIERNFAEGPSLPFLDVWFEDAHTGFAVGSFGMLIATTDGGKTWEPWFDRIDNEELMNLNGIRGIEGDLYIVGEHGVLFKLDRSAGRFSKINTGYPGSFFGLAGSANAIIAFGLKGTVFRSLNRGGTWEVVKMPSDATICAGVVLNGTGGFALVNSAGEVLHGNSTAQHFTVKKVKADMHLTGIVQLSGSKLLMTSLEGALIQTTQ
jgi:photosystem II stability/assembly factor-like uncharacterized protein